MRRTTTNRLVTAVLAAGFASMAGAQQVTTVVTHGFTAGNKGLWVQGMAEAILARAGEGTVYRYDPGDGRWQLVTSLGLPDDVVVLIFNWTAQPAGVAPGAVPILYNGEFEDGTYAGWLHHGGDGLGAIASDG
ncbi:MAG: hypothetical protein ACYTEI_15465, partial [Planctomycetota bacterium]